MPQVSIALSLSLIHGSQNQVMELLRGSRWMKPFCLPPVSAVCGDEEDAYILPSEQNFPENKRKVLDDSSAVQEMKHALID